VALLFYGCACSTGGCADGRHRPCDVKLAAVAGAWLDWLTMPIAIEIAALAALGVIGIRYYATGRQLEAALKFPFGLFLARASGRAGCSSDAARAN